MRVYELARQLGVRSREILDLLPSLGIQATSASSSLTDSDVARVRAALSGKEGEVVSFDKRTGKGAVLVPELDEAKPFEFDLQSTRLQTTKYAPIESGNKVHVQVEPGNKISSIAVDS